MTSAGPVHASRRPVTAVVAMLAVVLGALVLSIAGSHVEPSTRTQHHVQRALPGPGPARTGSSQPIPNKRPQPNGTEAAIGLLLLVGGLLPVLVAMFLLARIVVRAARNIRLHRRRPTEFTAELAPEDVVRRMATAVGAALADLEVADGPVNDAIIECWQRLLAAAAEAGITSRRSDTPQEAINRVFSAGDISATPLRALAELYREVRFSEHTMGADDRAKARGALTYILAELRDAVAERERADRVPS